jgi:signal transduction histidine kinase
VYSKELEIFEEEKELIRTINLDNVSFYGVRPTNIVAVRGIFPQDKNRMIETIDKMKYKKALEAANKELEAFSYSVSHDLRSPLRVIIGFSNLLHKYSDRLDDEANKYLEKIEVQAHQMDNLIVDLLSLSRISQQELIIKEMDLSSKANDVVGNLNQ